MKKLTVGSLFSGIGGLELGLERTGGFEVKWQVEIDDYATKVLEKHWPNVERYRDVREFPPDCNECLGLGTSPIAPYPKCEWCTRGVPDDLRVDVICGGFPCTEVSVANTSETGGSGLDGEHSGLWREFSRVLGLLRPDYALIENSPALIARGLDRILADLAGVGMDAVWKCLRASQFGARHRRERVFICAYSMRKRLEGRRLAHVFAEGQPVSALGYRADWPAISEPFGCRTADGISARVDRTRCLGNAVVPQVSQWIGERILEANSAM